MKKIHKFYLTLKILIKNYNLNKNKKMKKIDKYKLKIFKLKEKTYKKKYSKKKKNIKKILNL